MKLVVVTGTDLQRLLTNFTITKLGIAFMCYLGWSGRFVSASQPQWTPTMDQNLSLPNGWFKEVEFFWNKALPTSTLLTSEIVCNG
jgi:hypothetical protein